MSGFFRSRPGTRPAPPPSLPSSDSSSLALSSASSVGASPETYERVRDGLDRLLDELRRKAAGGGGSDAAAANGGPVRGRGGGAGDRLAAASPFKNPCRRLQSASQALVNILCAESDRIDATAEGRGDSGGEVATGPFLRDVLHRRLLEKVGARVCRAGVPVS